eukprot:3018781-Rhodomonas_salina.5
MRSSRSGCAPPRHRHPAVTTPVGFPWTECNRASSSRDASLVTDHPSFGPSSCLHTSQRYHIIISSFLSPPSGCQAGNSGDEGRLELGVLI